MDYLLGKCDNPDIYKMGSFKNMLKGLTSLIEEGDMEFELSSSSIVLKCCYEPLIGFFNEYKKILELKSSIDDDIYNSLLISFISKFDF